MAHITPVGEPDDFSALDGRNGKEESMQSFIQHHVLAALQPVAEQVRELEQQMQHMTKDLALTDSKVEENTSNLIKHDKDLLDMRTSHGQANTWMNQAKISLAKEAEVRGKLEREHDATKTAMAKANERHQHCMHTVESLERKLGQLSGGFDALKNSVVGAERGLEDQSKYLADLKDSHDDLTTRHMNATNKLDESTELAEMTRRDLQNLAKTHGRETQEVLVVLSDIDAFVKNLQEKLDASNDFADKQALELNKTIGIVHSMKTALDHKDGISRRVDTMQARDEEMDSSLKRIAEDLERLQKKVEAMNITDGGDKNAGGGNSELLDELRLKLECVESDMSKLGNIQSQHIVQLKDSIMAIEKLQRDQGRIKDHADSTEQELVGLMSSHKQAGSKMDLHALEQQRLQSDVGNMRGEVDSGFQQMKGDIGSTSRTLAKLRSHYDAANTNMFGLAKGFQEAGRHVVGSPQKTPRGPLPVLEPRRIMNDTQRPGASSSYA